MELDFADTAAAAAAAADDDDNDDGDTLLDLVLLELGVVDLLELDLPAERDAELLVPVPVCLVIGWLPLLTLLAVLFSFFEPEEEVEEDEDDEIMAATAGAGIDPLLLPPTHLSFPLSLTLSLLDEVVEPLTRGLDGTLKEVAEEWEFLSRECVCVSVCVCV